MRAALDALDACRRGQRMAGESAGGHGRRVVREIQAMQGPHIADTEDAAMDEKEKRMAAAAATARRSLDALTPLVAPAARPPLAAARTAFDRFMSINGELVTLSRRNTNVRSLALSLNEKQKLVAPCEESLPPASRGAWASAGYPAGRVPSRLDRLHSQRLRLNQTSIPTPTVPQMTQKLRYPHRHWSSGKY